MSKRRAGGFLGTLILAGIAAGVVKYLKDYSDVPLTDEEQIKNVRKNSSEVKEAAKRTYVAIKEKGDFKEAAGDLAKAAGAVVADSADIAKTAGAGAVQAVKEMKAKYDEDPEAAREEMVNNLKDMGAELSQKMTETAENVAERFRAASEEDEFEDACESAEDFTKRMANEVGEAAEDIAEDAAEAAENLAEKAAEAAENAEEAAEDLTAAAEEAKEAVEDVAEDLAEEAADAVEDAKEAAAEALEEATGVKITEDDID